jgi:hypothetical protein
MKKREQGMLPTMPIVPRYKLMICYDVKQGMHSVYYRYVVSEFVPALNDMGIYVLEAWHTAYGSYPMRQVEYVVEQLGVLEQAFETEKWQDLETRLKAFTTHYSRKVVPYRHGFQF